MTKKERLLKIIIPFVKAKRAELGLPENFPALYLMDMWRPQWDKEILVIMAENVIVPKPVPAGLTDKFQVMDQQEF